MQYDFDLQTLPNQSFNTTINNVDMEITIKMAGTNGNPIMLFNIQTNQTANNGYLCPDTPIFANQGILPYQYMIDTIGGQFFIETENVTYPNWQNFGTTEKLSFITLDELNG